MNYKLWLIFNTISTVLQDSRIQQELLQFLAGDVFLLKQHSITILLTRVLPFTLLLQFQLLTQLLPAIMPNSIIFFFFSYWKSHLFIYFYYSGGAVYSTGVMSINSSWFEYNKAVYGGAVYFNISDPMGVFRCSFGSIVENNATLVYI